MKSLRCYSILEVPFDFSYDDLIDAYKNLMTDILNSGKDSNQKNQELNEIMDIYNILSNEEKRKQYNHIVELTTLHVYEQMNTVNNKMREIVILCKKKEYKNISLMTRLSIKKTMKHIVNILENHEDVANFFEMNYLSCLIENNDLGKQMNKIFRSSSL